ncbi:MAG TPA: radical SAM protein, partial [Candidatus Campbellbacteria bacterium]|nr:radical SAM protein [Candidatus Campbellbacteria bacterium]
MPTAIPLIKKFRTEKNYYIYDTWTNEILKVHKDFWNYLDDGEKNNQQQSIKTKISNSEEVLNEINRAKEKGYLSTDRPEVATYYGWDHWKENVRNEVLNNLKQLSLNVTEICNFRCDYCVYSDHYKKTRNHSLKRMPWDIAKRAIDYAVNNSLMAKKKDRALGISFYGGEPLSNFELIKKSINYCKKEYKHKNIGYSMTTNASLINEEIANFLVDKNVNVSFSIDGPAELHNRYRKTINNKPTHHLTMKGYELIKRTANKKKKKFPNLVICVFPPPFDLFSLANFINSFDDIILRLTNPSSIDTTFFDQFDIEKENLNLYNQSNEFLRLYAKDIVSGNIRKRNRLGAAIYERDFLSIYKRRNDRMGKKTASHGQCVPGGRKLFVSCDGDFYPCERVNE